MTDERPDGFSGRALLPALLIAATLPSCRSLADRKEGASPAEIDAARARIDRVRDLVIESQLATDDDAEKAFWLSILQQLGDYRDALSRAGSR